MLKFIQYAIILAGLLISCKSPNDIIKNLEDFEGKITFQVTYPYNNTDPFYNLYPNDLVVYFKDNKMYGDLNGWGFRNRLLVDLNSKETSSYVDFLMPSKNFLIHMDEEKLNEKFSQKKPENLTITNETKILAGVECVKYTYESPENELKEIWLAKNTEAQKLNNVTPFSGLDEMLLEYEIEQMGMTVKVSAVSIEKIAVDDSLFIIPGNYSEIDEDSLEKFVDINYRSTFDKEVPL